MHCLMSPDCLPNVLSDTWRNKVVGLFCDLSRENSLEIFFNIFIWSFCSGRYNDLIPLASERISVALQTEVSFDDKCFSTQKCCLLPESFHNKKWNMFRCENAWITKYLRPIERDNQESKLLELISNVTFQKAEKSAMFITVVDFHLHVNIMVSKSWLDFTNLKNKKIKN